MMPQDVPWQREFFAARDPYTARVTLGLSAAATGGPFQPLDADLTAIAGLTGINVIYYRSAANTWSPVMIGSGLTFSGGTLSASVTSTIPEPANDGVLYGRQQVSSVGSWARAVRNTGDAMTGALGINKTAGGGLDLDVNGAAQINSTTDAISTATGALVLGGGLGVAKAIYAEKINISFGNATGPAAVIAGTAPNFSGNYIGISGTASHTAANTASVIYFGHTMTGTITFNAGATGAVFRTANYQTNINLQGGAPALADNLISNIALFGSSPSGTITTINGVNVNTPTNGMTGTPSVTVSAINGIYIPNQNVSGSGLTVSATRAINIDPQTHANGVGIYCQDNILCTSTKGFGYTTGAGGTVTQTGSRTTAVTLNKICGAITLVSAAGVGGWTFFTVNNSTVAANDVVLVTHKAGSTDRYLSMAAKVTAGSFELGFADNSGTTVEQPTFNFAVIKGSNA